ncbi:MAG TPA: hypothetical protein VFM18_09120 [Methanosarcina sp.]|nr:hypothetical protein [Methanosarcina sp.]
MPSFYIANSTKQNHDFVYRIPGNDKLFTVGIPFGQQRELHQKDLSTEEIDFILRQHKGESHEYITEASTIDRTSGYVGLIYSIGKPVSGDLIANAISENDYELDLSAKRYREESTLALDKKLAEDGAPASMLTTEVVQDVKNGVNEADAIAQGVEVNKPRGKRGG